MALAERPASVAGDREATTVLHVGGLLYAGEKAIVEGALTHRPGVVAVDANPVAQTATVTFDRNQTSVEELRRWVEEWRLPLRRSVRARARVRPASAGGI